MIGIIWGLLGALFVGVSDGIARKTTQSVSVLVLIAIVMGLSSVALTCIFLISGEWPTWNAYAWLVSAISGLLNLVALAFLYKALHLGPVAVAAPAASSFTIMLVIINASMGQPFHTSHLIAIVMVFVGVMMLAQPQTSSATKDYSATWLRNTALLGLAAATAISLRFFLAQEAGDILGAVPALYLNRIFAALFTCLVLCVAIPMHGRPSLPQGKIWVLVFIQAILESLALWAFLTGSSNGGRITATIGFAAFAAITTLTAWGLFSEKVPLHRWFWIAIIALGIIIGSL